jgi:nickel/cobalt transporter (NiCoT) family protein
MNKSLTGISSAILAMHVGLATALAYAAASCPLLLGPTLLAYGLGLRHAVDADHIAAIDNTVRRLMQDGQRPYAVGFFFALGHSTVVLCISLLVALSSSFIAREMPAFKEAGATIGIFSSSIFLLLIGAINLFFLRETFRLWRRSLKVEPSSSDPHTAGQSVAAEALPDSSFGPLSKLLKPVMHLVNGSNKMFFVGLLFGLGFDTASEVTFLTLTASSAAAALTATATSAALPPWAMLILPLAFTAGMTLIDSLDGVLMLSAYGWAFLKPTRKLFYNLTITATSVFIAFAIAAAQIGQYVSQNSQHYRQWGTWLTDWHFQDWGLYFIAAFAALWLGSLGAAKISSRKTANLNSFANPFIGPFLFAALAALIAASAQAASAVESTKKTKAVSLVQTHYFFGRSVVTFAENGFRMENIGNFKFVLVAHAPDWRVSVFRTDEKKFFSEGLEEFVGTGLVNNYLIAEKPMDFEKYKPYKSTVPFCKYPVQQIRTGWCTLLTIPLTRYAYRQQLEAIDYAANRMPTSGGIAVKFHARSDNKDFFAGDRKKGVFDETYISTEKISAVEVPVSTFEVPKGFTKAASIREVVSGANVRQESEAFFFDSPQKK